MNKERPILFSGPMVRAILEGRKTQTRRMLKPQPPKETGWFVENQICGRHTSYREFEGLKSTGMGDGHVCFIKCPYGQPGERLWVKETFTAGRVGKRGHWVAYRQPAPGYCKPFGENETKWTSSMFMPRWASRILLEIVSVRVERLQDISQQDAMAEGAPPSHRSIDRISRQFGYEDFSRSWFAQLWQSINGPESWAANPWVWVVEFKVLEVN